MLIAMGIAAVFCFALGFPLFYEQLYSILPFQVREGINPDGTNMVWHNYSASHVLTYLQLLLFAALAFVVLMKTRLYPPELSKINLDTDVIYQSFYPYPPSVGGLVSFVLVDCRLVQSASIQNGGLGSDRHRPRTVWRALVDKRLGHVGGQPSRFTHYQCSTLVSKHS